MQTTSARESRLHADGAPRRENGRPHVNGVVPAPKRKRHTAVDQSTLLPSYHSEQSREVLMQTGPGSRADRMIVAYHSPAVEIELSARGETLLSGAFESELFVDGAPLVPTGDWQSVCWYSDDDCDYLELQLHLSGSVRIDRQMLLARRSHFAMMADAVVGPQAEKIEYRMHLPVANSARMRFDSPTRECRLRSGGQTARVFPLGLPQGRALGTSGCFLDREGRLELTQAGAGTAVHVPIVFDWHPRRRALAADWRSLTVSENGQAVKGDCAAGYRLRIGKHQFVMYRSLIPTDEARAVLGHHTRYETVVGTFDSDGDVDPLVMVEAE
jgi:hypothetical protein